jgi:hypothetical protein
LPTFTEVLSLCKEAGLVKVGLIAIDGTKLHANASHHANLDYEQLAREILKEAARIDAAEDSSTASSAGDELPGAPADQRRASGRAGDAGASSSAIERKAPRMQRWLTARNQRAWSSSLIPR